MQGSSILPEVLSSSRQREAWARSEAGDLFVYRVLFALWSHLTIRLKGLAQKCGGAGPQYSVEAAVHPQKCYRNLRVGNSELTSSMVWCSSSLEPSLVA